MDIASFREIAGMTAGVLVLMSCIIYVMSILRHETRPDRSTWWILFLGSGILAASYIAAGATDTVWVALAYCGGYFIAAMLSLWYGEGKFTLTLFQKVCIAGAFASAALWWFTSDPVIAMYFQMIMETFGLLPTIEKTFRSPASESRAAWAIATFAALINMAAIGSWTLAIATYPVFILVTNAIVAVLTLRHTQVRQQV